MYHMINKSSTPDVNSFKNILCDGMSLHLAQKKLLSSQWTLSIEIIFGKRLFIFNIVR